MFNGLFNRSPGFTFAMGVLLALTAFFVFKLM